MNLSWAEKIAKNALLSAQKKIDLVLDIKAEEESDNLAPKSESDFNDDQGLVTARSELSDVEEPSSAYQVSYIVTF